MTTTDPIADMLTRIRNTVPLKKEKVIIPFSKIKFEIAKILEKEGYVKKVEKSESNFATIDIELKYTSDKESVIQNLKRISKPGRRVYVEYNKIPRVLNGLGMAIISTSAGLMSDREAKSRKIGGEVICEIY
ncbi:30S ribosomal protein S8 [Patescibacteria group bacterium]|nr:30S ribosomal protein S8 [Patescibacteria group bacterium]MBU1075338.1 30S ribosomal protein S8 [Patescibacteria group bacterium]MBU1951410.1 30S ribosomal protein S8 [Patescibacteria group bacterium]